MDTLEDRRLDGSVDQVHQGSSLWRMPFREAVFCEKELLVLERSHEGSVPEKNWKQGRLRERSHPDVPLVVGYLPMASRDVCESRTHAARRNTSPQCMRHRGRCRPGLFLWASATTCDNEKAADAGLGLVLWASDNCL